MLHLALLCAAVLPGPAKVAAVAMQAQDSAVLEALASPGVGWNLDTKVTSYWSWRSPWTCRGYDDSLGDAQNVVCNDAGYVTQLNLGYQSITGSIPSQISALLHLTYLIIYNNMLSGSIPPQLSSLTNLKALKGSYNRLTGSIPAELGYLSNLQELDLGYNRLNGSISWQLGNLVSLQYLRLGNNMLSGSLPSELGNLVLLKNLQLQFNQLSGRVPEQLGTHFAPLPVFSVSFQSNYFTSVPPVLNCINIATNCAFGVNTGGFCSRTSSECESFCNATIPDGPCSGHGTCTVVGSNYPGSGVATTCSCDAGYSLDPTNAFSCLIVPGPPPPGPPPSPSPPGPPPPRPPQPSPPPPLATCPKPARPTLSILPHSVQDRKYGRGSVYTFLLCNFGTLAVMNLQLTCPAGISWPAGMTASCVIPVPVEPVVHPAISFCATFSVQSTTGKPSFAVVGDPLAVQSSFTFIPKAGSNLSVTCSKYLLTLPAVGRSNSTLISYNCFISNTGNATSAVTLSCNNFNPARARNITPSCALPSGSTIPTGTRTYSFQFDNPPGAITLAIV